MKKTLHEEFTVALLLTIVSTGLLVLGIIGIANGMLWTSIISLGTIYMGTISIMAYEITRLPKTKPKLQRKTKYVGSDYEHRYHLRTCRFIGAIKPEYLVESNNEEDFKKYNYKPCKACNPHKK